MINKVKNIMVGQKEGKEYYLFFYGKVKILLITFELILSKELSSETHIH